MIDGRFFVINGHKLREFRQGVIGATQREWAAYIGMSEPMIRVIEQTKAHRLQVVNALQVAVSLGLDLKGLENYFSGILTTLSVPQRDVAWVKAVVGAIEENRKRAAEEHVQSDVDMVRLRRVPYFDFQMSASGWSDGAEGRTRDEADGFVDVPSDAPSDAFAFRIKGDCMEPQFQNGSIIICVPVRPGDHGANFVAGKAYYFQTSDGKCTFKLVYFEPQRGRWRLESTNKKYEPIFVPEQMMARMSRAIKLVRDIE
jgi:phage repressor protein C with HTH and peptisase S24 domain